MGKKQFSDIGIKKILKGEYEGKLIYVLLDAADNRWCIASQVGKIKGFEKSKQFIDTNNLHALLLRKKAFVRFSEWPFKVNNRGLLIFPFSQLDSLRSATKRKPKPAKPDIVVSLPEPALEPWHEVDVLDMPEDEHQFTEYGVFDFMGHPLRGFIDEHKRPWMINNEVCAVLDLQNPRQSAASLEEWERAFTITDTPGGRQPTILVNESGMYSLVFKSRKPEAKKFKKWIAAVVLPSIRETGAYIQKPQIEAPKFDLWEELKDPQGVLRVMALLKGRDDQNATLQRELINSKKDVEKKKKMIEYKDNRYREATHQLIRAEKKSQQFERLAKAFQNMRASDGTSTITAIAKMFQIRRKLLIEYMSSKDKGDKKWIYRTETNKRKRKGPWLPMNWTIKRGYLFYNVVEYGDERKGGTEPQARVTENGWRALLLLIQDNPYYVTPEGIRVRLLTYQEENQIATQIDDHLNMFDENGKDIHQTKKG